MAEKIDLFRRALAGAVPPEAFTVSGIRPEARAEELSIDDWARLTAACTNEPSPS